jgi:hypothetical protein
MRGRIRARSGDSFRQNAKRVEEFIGEYAEPALRRSAGVYWCRYFTGTLKEQAKDAEALVGEGRRLKDDAGLRSQLGTNPEIFPKFRTFMRYVEERERPGPTIAATDAAASVFGLLEEFSLFSCKEGEGDDDPL